MWRRRREIDLQRELENDLELEAAEQQENGLSAQEARYAAQRAIGDRQVEADELHLRDAQLGEEDLVRVGDRYLPAGNLEDLGRACHARTLPGLSRRVPRVILGPVDSRARRSSYR